MTVKFGVALPDELASEFEEAARKLGFKTRSSAVAEAVRYFVAENVWRLEPERCIAGVIVYSYSKGSAMLEKKLTGIGHSFLDIVVASLHVHLTEDKCMEATIVKGNAAKIKQYLSNLRSMKQIENLKVVFTVVS